KKRLDRLLARDELVRPVGGHQPEVSATSRREWRRERTQQLADRQCRHREIRLERIAELLVRGPIASDEPMRRQDRRAAARTASVDHQREDKVEGGLGGGTV